jgi:isoleucyl-tRNA synthetase
MNDQNEQTNSKQAMGTVDAFPSQPNFPEMEEQVMEYWRRTDAFKKSVEMRPADKQYVFYDGPPFATGMPHYGHLLGSTSKDVIPRYWTMKGYRVERVWGWDCHGVPIENMIEKKLQIKGGKKGIEELGIANFNNACRAEVLRLDKEWERIIERLGRWVDFEHNYKTMDTSYMESVWWGFKELYEKGLVYQGRKVVLYCPRCSTPLSNFEIAMDNSYEDTTDNSVFVKFKLETPLTGEDEYFLAWTTTPWTLPGNVALAVLADAEYVLIETASQVDGKLERLWIAANRVEPLMKGQDYTKVKEVRGEELVGQHYQPLFEYVQSDKPAGWSVLAADFVSLDDGTGIVHTAALFGEDDYALALKSDLPLVPTLDDQGRFLPFVEVVAGQFYKKAEQPIMDQLQTKGLLWGVEKIVHSYPFCYRCHTPLYFNAVPAWFIDVKKLKPDLIAANEQMNWFPEHLKEGRFGKGLQTAPDWNISRSRYWGTPMPIWAAEVAQADGSVQVLRRIVGSIKELHEWAVDPAHTADLTDLHREFLDDIEVWLDQERTIKGRRIAEVFDCWVESGSMPFASRHYPFANKEEFEGSYPAQFVSEYIAQTRAWFYTMHVMSVGIFGSRAVDNTLTTGTILAEDGSKMSKSKNNYPDPMKLINSYGVDSLRLYLMSSTVMKGENLNFSEKDVADLRKKVFVIWYNCVSFYKMLAKNAGFDLTELRSKLETVDASSLQVMDRWLLSRLENVTAEVTASMDRYDVVRASRTAMTLVDELSTWYLRRSRDRLKAAGAEELELPLFGYALVHLAQLFAPFTPFFSEFIYHQVVSAETSIHHTDWPAAHAAWSDQLLEAEMLLARQVVEKGLAQRLEKQLKVRQPLQTLTVTAAVAAPAEDVLAIVREELNVKQIAWQKSSASSSLDESGAALLVELDTTLTPELKAEGEARELIRAIQQRRKDAGLTFTQSAVVTLPAWPAEWQREIERKTNSTLRQGTEWLVETS